MCSSPARKREQILGTPLWNFCRKLEYNATAIRPKNHTCGHFSPPARKASAYTKLTHLFIVPLLIITANCKQSVWLSVGKGTHPVSGKTYSHKNRVRSLHSVRISFQETDLSGKVSEVTRRFHHLCNMLENCKISTI